MTVSLHIRGLPACAAAAFLLLASPLTWPAEPPSSTVAHIRFSEYSPLAGSTEIARRTLSPLAALEVARQAARIGKTLVAQPVTLSEEDFVIYVPSHRPPRGYALLVFIPPWQEARLPAGWAPILERYGTIFVGSARSGNEESVMDRREPLALLAALNVMQRFPVDRGAVFIGGFSGGSRVAQRLALAYPDVFDGAILNAGSDPLGGQDFALPPRELFYRFQEHSRIVYVTGETDPRLAEDQDSIRSMHRWCVFAVQGHLEASAGHEVLGPNGLAWALSAALQERAAPSRDLSSCRAGIDQDIAAQLHAAELQKTGAMPGNAEKLLRRIDARFGGLAAPGSVDLAHQLWRDSDQ